jgi:hypothetical protein
MAKGKVFEKCVKLQSHEVKNFSTNRKVLLYGTHIRNMKPLSLTIQKIWPMLKSFADRQIDGRTGQRLYAPDHSTRGIKIRKILIFKKFIW